MSHGAFSKHPKAIIPLSFLPKWHSEKEKDDPFQHCFYTMIFDVTNKSGAERQHFSNFSSLHKSVFSGCFQLTFSKPWFFFNETVTQLDEICCRTTILHFDTLNWNRIKSIWELEYGSEMIYDPWNQIDVLLQVYFFKCNEIRIQRISWPSCISIAQLHWILFDIISYSHKLNWNQSHMSVQKCIAKWTEIKI